MKGLLTLFSILVLFTNLKSQNKSIVLVSFSNCTFCNNSVRIIRQENQDFLASSVLLGSTEDANVKQLRSLATENFGIDFKDYKTDTKLFNKITNGVYYKLPCFAILNNKDEVIFKTTVDSLIYYSQIIIEYLLPKGKIKRYNPIKNKRLEEIGGYSSIKVNSDKVGITFFNKSDRIYILDNKTNKLDSFYFSNDSSLLNKLFISAKEQNCSSSEAIEFPIKVSLPFDLHHFGSLSLKGDEITTTDHLLYVNPKEVTDYINPIWKQFIFTASLLSKKFNFYYLDIWHDTLTKPEIFREFDFIDSYYSKESDSTFLIAAKKIIPNNQVDLNLFLIRFKIINETKIIPIGIDSFEKIAFVDFKGNSLNKPDFIIPFDIKNGLLFFNESPNILFKNNWINLKSIVPSIDWIYDIDKSDNGDLIKCLVRENNLKMSVLYIDLGSKKLINKVIFPKVDSKSNLNISNDLITFLDFNGILRRYLITN